MAKDHVTAMYVESGHEYSNGRINGSALRPPNGRTKSHAKSPPDRVDEIHARAVRDLSSDLKQRLADELNLPAASLDALAIGWLPDRRWWNPETQEAEGELGCWEFPECDGQGRIIGLGLRWPGGHKGQLPGSRRGLTLPEGCRDLADPVIVVEGPSDVIAGRLLGLNVIGRPNNSGGAESIAQLCRNRRVIILGENDRKPDGAWPGKSGAQAVARKLESISQRPVPVAFPPGHAKDLRNWLLDRVDDPSSFEEPEFLNQLGRQFTDAIQPPEILLTASAPTSRRSERVTVKAFQWSASPGSGPIYSDKVNLDAQRSRQKFASAIAKVVEGVDEDDLQNRLLQLEIPEPKHDQRQRPAGVLGEESTQFNGRDRPTIQINERQLRDVRQDALEALRQANDPPKLFTRAGGIARLSMTLNDRQESTSVIQQLGVDAMRGELTNVADWVTARSDGEGGLTLAPSLPPIDVSRDLLSLPQVDLPALIGVITCPAFAPDGSLIIDHGFHEASGLWHQRTLDDLQEIPSEPDDVALHEAREFLLDVLVDFPFNDEASRVHAIALTDLSPEQIRAYRIADNKTNELATWDFDLLPIELQELRELDINLELLGFGADELAKILGEEVKDGLTDPDDVPEPPDKATTQCGELIILGSHRLLCGDSSSEADLDLLLDGQSIQLVNTDPPYNVRVEPR
jgi:hypothetical protein